MHQSTTPSLSQIIWPRWASRQFLTLPIVQTLLPVTFAYSLSSEAVVMRQMRRWKGLWQKRTSMGPSRSCWKCIAAGGDYFEGDYNFMCVLSIKVPKRKKSANLFNHPRNKQDIASLKLEVRNHINPSQSINLRMFISIKSNYIFISINLSIYLSRVDIFSQRVECLPMTQETRVQS